MWHCAVSFSVYQQARSTTVTAFLDADLPAAGFDPRGGRKSISPREKWRRSQLWEKQRYVPCLSFVGKR
jgi:hypothetical protein